MAYAGYSEGELVSNRAALLLYGGTEAERRAWAEEAAEEFSAEGPLVQVVEASALPAALAKGRGVVFVPDLLRLGSDAQMMLVRCLLEREERPKLVLGLGSPPEAARTKGLLREDLAYRLERARVDLSVGALKEAIRARRAKKVSAKRPVATPSRGKPVAARRK